ncbi:hypothetical protein SASPL_122586 [Salvia splendens]|uniref:mRNA-decapping enzyme 1B n=1 Tax=Salvia splendens TaxID=180675 RepID=A0A8X8ZS74_SALSN|nr:hypothetical protein SASPL_122586 [Salvia splendens]
MSKRKEKVKPNLDEQITKHLNLTVLQRIDHCVQEIIAGATHVAIYEFDIDTSEWVCSCVSMFLHYCVAAACLFPASARYVSALRRNTEPHFQFLVMNRQSTGLFIFLSVEISRPHQDQPFIQSSYSSDKQIMYIHVIITALQKENLVESLWGDFEYEVHGPYVLYRNHCKEVNGIWFYDTKECEEISNLFGSLRSSYEQVTILVCHDSETLAPQTQIESFLKHWSSHMDWTSIRLLFLLCFLSIQISVKTEIKVEKDDTLEPSSTAIAKVEKDDQSCVKIPSLSQSSTALVSDPPTSLPAPAHVTSPTVKFPVVENSEPEVSKACRTDLVKPSSFLSPRPSSSHVMPPITSFAPPPPTSPLISPGNLKRPYGTLLLPLFPPPTSPQSLTPTYAPTYMQFSREKVRKALQSLIQDNQFIEIVYRAVMNATED